MRLTGPQPCPGARGPHSHPQVSFRERRCRVPARSNGFRLWSLFRLQFLIRLIHKELSCPGSAAGDQVL